MFPLLAACAPSLSLPEDPTQPGVPVGVRTESVAGLTLEVWYPAHPRHAGEPGEAVQFADALDTALLDRLGNPEVPALSTPAVRDAEPHPDGPFAAVVFSHGFGGSRVQSVGLTTHLAARGFVVVATDHAGRSIAELAPCMFSPPMEGCDLALDDPAPPDLRAIADWLDSGPEQLEILDGYGLFGHSAGGGSTVTVGNADPRFTALAPMAGGGAVEREVAVQRWAGTCDGIVLAASSADAHEASVAGSFLELTGAGHLAFSDLCALDLGGLIAAFEQRDDVSALFLEQARQLAVDGCPGAPPIPELAECGAFLPLSESEPLLRRNLAAFFEAELRDEGTGPTTTDDGPLAVR